MKEILWNNKAKEFIRELPIKIKREIGTLLMILQQGNILSEPQSKAIRSIHKNAFELRVKDHTGAYRVIYVLAFSDKILIPHAFMKKTQKTPLKEITTAIKRLEELQQ